MKVQLRYPVKSVRVPISETVLTRWKMVGQERETYKEKKREREKWEKVKEKSKLA